MMFMTYPIQEYMTLANTYKVFGIFEQEVCCQAENTGIFNAIQSSNKVNWVTCGGDSDNDWKGVYQNINLAYGRKTGFGGNGSQ